MEIQLPHSLIVTYQLYKNVFSCELNERSAWNVVEIVLNFLEIIVKNFIIFLAIIYKG